MQDRNTIAAPWGPVTFVPVPKNQGLLAGLLTVNLPPGVKRGDLYTIVVRQVTDGVTYLNAIRAETIEPGAHWIKAAQAVAVRMPPVLSWRRVLGAFQINITIATKGTCGARRRPPRTVPLDRRKHLPQSRWYPVMQRYILSWPAALRFGGDPGTILPSPTATCLTRGAIIRPTMTILPTTR